MPGRQYESLDHRRLQDVRAFQRTFGVKLMDIDVLAATASSIAKAIHEGELDGTPVHPEAKKLWLGGTLDLSRAYKQVPLSAKSRRFCVLGFVIDGKWTYYRSDVLPFGASASVFSFIRISRSIHIMCSFLSAITTVFFDDYPLMTTEAGSDVLKMAMSSVLTLLGWSHAKEGKEALNFNQKFNALGAEMDGNGFFKSGEVLVLQGHLNFASGFYLSKILFRLRTVFSLLHDSLSMRGVFPE